MVVFSAAIAAVPALRQPVLRAAGRALVFDEPIGPADIIVVASDAFGAGVLEAADLVHNGVATRVAVFADLPDPVVDHEFMRRGIPYEDEAARSVRQLKALGVETIEVIPTLITGTEDEGRVLPPWCDQNGFRSVVVVAETDHTRRLRRVLRRTMSGHMTTVTIRASRYSQFDPARWWESRAGVRTGIVELEKLLLDVVRHPIS
jgi:hypothetical protein